MLKAKWLYSELPISITKLSSLMKDNQYSEYSGSGFLLSTATPLKLIGKYIEKIVEKSIVEDPFGETSLIESICYYVCKFNWNSKSNYMYISEPPRSLRKFTNKIHDLTGLGFVLTEINVSPEHWLKVIESYAKSMKVLQISSFGIRTSPSSTAKVMLTGSQDVRDAFQEVVADKRYFIDSIKFEAELDDYVVKGELTKSGICRIKSSNSKFILDKLRESLEKTTIHHG